MAPAVVGAGAAATGLRGVLSTIVPQLLAAGFSTADITKILSSPSGRALAFQQGMPDGGGGTPPGFNRQNLVYPFLTSAAGASVPDIVSAFRGQLPDTSNAPGSKAILSEDLVPRLIEQERARQRGQALWGNLLGLDPGPTAKEVEERIRGGRRQELTELGERERAKIALQGEIDAAIRQIETGAALEQARLEVGGGIKRQELQSLGDIQRQRVSSGYSTAQNLLNTVIQNMTAPQNLAQSSVLQQMATQVP